MWKAGEQLRERGRTGKKKRKKGRVVTVILNV